MLVVIVIFALLAIFYYEYKDYSSVENDTLDDHRQSREQKKKPMENDLNVRFEKAINDGSSKLTMDWTKEPPPEYRSGSESSNGSRTSARSNCKQRAVGESKAGPAINQEADPTMFETRI